MQKGESIVNPSAMMLSKALPIINHIKHSSAGTGEYPILINPNKRNFCLLRFKRKLKNILVTNEYEFGDKKVSPTEAGLVGLHLRHIVSHSYMCAPKMG